MNLYKILVIILVAVFCLNACSPAAPAVVQAPPSAAGGAQSPAATEGSALLTDTPAAVPPKPLPTATPKPTQPPPSLPPLPQGIGANICPGTQPSILMPGRVGRVSTKSAAPNRVRDEAATGNIVGQIPSGGYFDVNAGPKCINDMAWFQVRAENGVEGWMGEGTAEEYWVEPVATEAQNISGQTIQMMELIFSLPEEIGSKTRTGEVPYDPKTNAAPASITRFAEYPLPVKGSVIYVFPVEDYLYFRPNGRQTLEQARSAINILLAGPKETIAVPSPVDTLIVKDVRLPQAGPFGSGYGMHAIAMVGPSGEKEEPAPSYLFYGFTSDMKYFIFARFDVQLTFGQFGQASMADFKPSVSLLDQIFGWTTINAELARQAGNVSSCPGAPPIILQVGDWAQVNLDPPMPNNVRSQPGSAGTLTGKVEPGENVLVLEGPRCANGFTWWRVRSLNGLEGWSAEGDASGYWYVDPIRVWNPLPTSPQGGSTQAQNLREIQIKTDRSLITSVKGEYFPLLIIPPTPQTQETPWAFTEPRGRVDMFDRARYSQHSFYTMEGEPFSFTLIVYDLTEWASRSYIEIHEDCTRRLQNHLSMKEPVKAYLNLWCGMWGGSGAPGAYMGAAKFIDFKGGKGVSYFFASANYQTINQLHFYFQGLSDDGRYMIYLATTFDHPYIVDWQTLDSPRNPFLQWTGGDRDKLDAAYKSFNSRMEVLLDAGVIPLYPDLEMIDAMLNSISFK
jgi:hypothetical protein